jgi:ATP-dependent HslUV protease subunit HslV
VIFRQFPGRLNQLTRAAVEMAKDWRTERALRKLEALLSIADSKTSLIISGNGDVIEPEYDLIAIGSGGPFAQSAARALLENFDLGSTPAITQGYGNRTLGTRLTDNMLIQLVGDFFRCHLCHLCS